jgi:hypothetical protein
MEGEGILGVEKDGLEKEGLLGVEKEGELCPNFGVSMDEGADG